MIWDTMYEDKYAVERVKLSVKLLTPYLKSIDKKPLVLELGCFTRLAKDYLPIGIVYVGLDKMPYHKDNFLVDLNTTLGLPKDCDGVLCLEVLEHLLNPRSVMESIKGCLAPSGALVLSLPNEATLFHRIRGLFGIMDAECFSSDGKHLHLPSLKQCERFIAESGFTIKRRVNYIDPLAKGSRQEWIGRILKLVPDRVHQFMADVAPSLFARGFIFLVQ